MSVTVAYAVAVVAELTKNVISAACKNIRVSGI